MPEITPRECLFCKLVRGEISSKKVYEDENVVAFLDINPASKGHCLVIPKKHSVNILDTDERELENLIRVVKLLSTVIKEKLEADAINILLNSGKRAGQLVNHVHFHIIPRYPDDKILIMLPRGAGKPEDLDAVQKIITTKQKSKKEERELDWMDLG